MIAVRSGFPAVVSLLCAFAAAASAAPPHTAYALIVTNNHSSTLGRPDLQYADDDGAHYYELFETIAPVDHLRLLTELDRDTAREFPQLSSITVAPSRAND